VVNAVDLALGGRGSSWSLLILLMAAPRAGWRRLRCMPGRVQWVRDIPHAGQVEVVVRKPRAGVRRAGLSARHRHPGNRAGAAAGAVYDPAESTPHFNSSPSATSNTRPA
jgi:hypothetical protein